MSDLPLRDAGRLGILGGTFDPIHHGHLAMAEAARERYALDAVLFIPTRVAPHKQGGEAGVEQRYLMAILATSGNPFFFVSRLEIERSGPSYTVETLRTLHAQLPSTQLYFIIGADMAVDFPTWREPDAIMELAQVVAINRPGTALDQLRHAVELPLINRMDFLTVPGLDISATDLRTRAHQGRSLRYLTPDAVAAFIEKEKLYS